MAGPAECGHARRVHERALHWARARIRTTRSRAAGCDRWVVDDHPRRRSAWHRREPPPHRRERPIHCPERTGLWRTATCRPDGMPGSGRLTAGVAAMIEARRPPTRLTLEPLGRSELADLIAGIEGERPTGSALVLVAERSGGNPLVAEELLAARRELSGASLTGSLDDLVVARVGL